MLRDFTFFLHTELLLRFRHSQTWLYPIGFFVIIVSLFPITFSPDPVFLQTYIPGCIWIAALLASQLSIEGLFIDDMEEGGLEQQLLTPISFSLQIIAKLCAQWLVSQLPLILLTPAIGLMFELPALSIAVLCLALLIGTPILTLMGTLGVALTLGLRQPGMLLGLLIMPLTIPVLIFGVSIVQQFQAGFDIKGPLALLTALSIIAIILLPPTIAATVRIGVDD